MVVPFMLRRTTMSAFLSIMPPTADMVMDFTAITGLGHASTAGAGGVMAGGVMDGEVMVGEDVGGVEAEIMRQAHPVRTTAMLKSTPARFSPFR